MRATQPVLLQRISTEHILDSGVDVTLASSESVGDRNDKINRFSPTTPLCLFHACPCVYFDGNSMQGGRGRHSCRRGMFANWGRDPDHFSGNQGDAGRTCLNRPRCPGDRHDRRMHVPVRADQGRHRTDNKYELLMHPPAYVPASFQLPINSKVCSNQPGAYATAVTGAELGRDENYGSAPRTSCEFANAVRDAYLDAGGAPLEVDGQPRQMTISAISPVTKRPYDMYCSGYYPVECRGGEQALVYLT